MFARQLLVLTCLVSGVAAALPGNPQSTLPQQQMQANILIVRSHGAIAAWALNPGGGDTGRLRRVPLGQKVYVPVVVSGIDANNIGAAGISADFEIVGPAGKVLHAAKNCCSATNRGDPRTPGLVVLNPVLEYEPSDPLGTYELRATVTYGTQTAKATEYFSVVAPTRAKTESGSGANAADLANHGPARRFNGRLDARSCLGFADNIAVIRCTERLR